MKYATIVIAILFLHSCQKEKTEVKNQNNDSVLVNEQKENPALVLPYKSLVMPAMILVIGSAPCPYSFPGSVLCSDPLIPHPGNALISALQKSYCSFSHFHKQIP